MSLQVKVSDFYHGTGWYDPKSKMTFTKKDGVISVPDGVNMYNINRYINLNNLIVVEENKPIVEKETIINLTPGKLLAEAIPPIIDKIVEIIEETDIDSEEESIKDEEEIKDEKVACQFCGKEYSPRGVAVHERSCKSNPENE